MKKYFFTTLTIALLSGCVSNQFKQDEANSSPDLSVWDANKICLSEMREKYPSDDSALIGGILLGAVGGAIGGAASTQNQDIGKLRRAYFDECMKNHGWVRNN